MNEEILCRPLQPAFLPLHHQLLSCSRTLITPSPSCQDACDLLGKGGDAGNQITGFLHLNQRIKSQQPPASYRRQSLLLITSVKEGRLEGFSIAGTAWKSLQLALTLFNVAASSVLCRLHGDETPLLQTVSLSLFIQHTKHSCNCSNLQT